MTFPAGRSTAIKNAIEAVLVPDVMIADLSQMGVPAAYLGVETQGLSGSKFGGRALTDDVVDISLMAIFGPLIPELSALNPNLFGGVIPDDGNELPTFETDNVGAGDKVFLNTFPISASRTERFIDNSFHKHTAVTEQPAVTAAFRGVEQWF